MSPGPDPEVAPEIPADEPFAAQVRTARAAPATVAESTIVATILGWIDVQPGVHGRKVHQTAVTGAGEPDLDICWHGRAVKIEVKRPGERPTPVQLRRLQCWQRAGALVGWVCSLEELQALIVHVGDPDWQADLTRPGAGDAG